MDYKLFMRILSVKKSDENNKLSKKRVSQLPVKLVESTIFGVFGEI